MSLRKEVAIGEADQRQPKDPLTELAGEIAHELANPLAAIYSHCRQLRGLGTDELNDGTIGIIVQSIQETCGHIEAIILGLRSIYAENAHLVTERTDVRKLLKVALDITEARQGDFAAKIQTTHLEDALFVDCAPDQIIQVLVNLLNNACEAVCTFKDPWVRLDVMAVPDCIRFSVIDCGPGIDSALRLKIMQPFFTTKSQGKGLGLSIAKKIIELHGRRLKVDVECANTRFFFDLKRLK